MRLMLIQSWKCLQLLVTPHDGMDGVTTLSGQDSLTSHAGGWCQVVGGTQLTWTDCLITLYKAVATSQSFQLSLSFTPCWFCSIWSVWFFSKGNLNLAWPPIPCSTLSRLVAIAAPCVVNVTCLQKVNRLTKCRESEIWRPTATVKP